MQAITAVSNLILSETMFRFAQHDGLILECLP